MGEYFLSLEKDPQQEDFLQGRMLGNPYSCNEPGLAPLMRDVKNKICTGKRECLLTVVCKPGLRVIVTVLQEEANVLLKSKKIIRDNLQKG